MHPRRIVRLIIIRGLALSFGLLLAVSFAEIALRVLGVSYPLPYVADPFCGTRLKPNFSALFQQEGRAWAVVNSHGMRCEELTIGKPPGTLRIAILGDSYAEALQVDQEKTFWSVMKNRLRDCPTINYQNIEVLNCGVSGFGTAQELELLKQYVWEFEPDIVLLAFLTGNDISDNSPVLSNNPVRPFYRIQQDSLVLDNNFLSHPTYIAANSFWGRTKTALINSSRCLQLARQSWTQLRQPKLQNQTTIENGLDPIYAPPTTSEWSEAWNVTEKLLETIHAEVRKHGKQFYVVTLTNSLQVEPDKDLRARQQQTASITDLFYPDKRIEAVGNRNGFKVTTLAPQMQQKAEQTGTYYHGFPNTKLGTGHWNEAGHQIAGEIIASELCEWLQIQTEENSPNPSSATQP